MEYKSEYIEAIQHVNAAVRESDPQYWFPKIINMENVNNRPDGSGYFVYDLGNGEKGSGSGHSGTDHGHAHSAALLRLIRFKQPCTLFAFPIEDAIDKNGSWKNVQREDIVVGYISDLDDTYIITPEWNDKHVYPMIGNSRSHLFYAPEDADWLLCAALDTPYRKAVSLYCQATATTKELELSTPELNIVERELII
jgi:hypothetical protein